MPTIPRAFQPAPPAPVYFAPDIAEAVRYGQQNALARDTLRMNREKNALARRDKQEAIALEAERYQTEQQQKQSERDLKLEKQKLLDDASWLTVARPKSLDEAVSQRPDMHPKIKQLLQADLPRTIQWAGTLTGAKQTPEEEMKVFKEKEAFKAGLNPKPEQPMTLEEQREELRIREGIKASAKPKGAKPIDIKGEQSLRKEFTDNPEVAEYIKINTQMNRAKVAIEQARTGKGSMNAVDQSLIMLLNKILDPTSVVRESEYARTPEGMSIINRLKGYAGKLEAGGAGLSADEREGMYGMIDKFYQVSEKMYNDQVNYYTDLAKRYEIPPENIIRLGGAKGGESYKKSKTANDYLKRIGVK